MPGVFKYTIISGLIAMAGYSTASGFAVRKTEPGNFHELNNDSVRSVEAFRKVYSVLMSPRCVNCHPAGDIPLQGDDSHLHAMSPRRGTTGKGIFAMKCANCHQSKNTAGVHTPPGHSNWHLPPADMKMVFEGRSPHDLARQLTNPEQNGHKTIKQLIAHADDGLVVHSWDMGGGRTKPPLTHEQFKKEWITWLENGAYAPPPEKARR